METSIEKYSPLARNLLCVLEQLSMVKIKKDSHKFDLLKKEFELISKENSSIKCYCSVDESELIIVVDSNPPIRSFIV